MVPWQARSWQEWRTIRSPGSPRAAALWPRANGKPRRTPSQRCFAPERIPGRSTASASPRGSSVDVDEGLETRQRAFAAYLAAGEHDAAARLGVWISHQYLVSGRGSLANGWLERAERALEGRQDCAGRGWVVLERARRAGSVEEAAEGARRAMELGRACGDDDLEVFALSLVGRSEIEGGAFDDGMRKLEEAMAAATAGRIGSPHTLGEAYCNLIAACTSAGDWERAAEWCELVDAYAGSHEIMPLLGACRTIHADVLVASGRWDGCRDGARGRARRRMPAPIRRWARPTVSTLASLRVRQGRLAEAEQLLAGREEEPASLLALAELRLAEGEPRVAAALLERGLAAAPDDSARLVAAPRPARRRAHRRRRARCRPRGCAAPARARGRVGPAAPPWHGPSWHRRGSRSAGGPNDEARECARRALETFGRLGMPHDAAEARIELARAVAAERPRARA